MVPVDFVGPVSAVKTWCEGDFDGDWEIDLTDFSDHFLLKFYCDKWGTYDPGKSILEPGTVVLLGLGSVLLAYVTATPAPPEHSRVT